MNFCKDCVHYQEPGDCVHSLVMTNDPVKGELFEEGRRSCWVERSEGWLFSYFEGACGKMGRFFKHKPLEKLRL